MTTYTQTFTIAVRYETNDPEAVDEMLSIIVGNIPEHIATVLTDAINDEFHGVDAAFDIQTFAAALAGEDNS